MAFGKSYGEQLPRLNAWTLERLILLIGSVAGIVALFFGLVKVSELDENIRIKIFVYELAALAFCLFSYILVTNFKKLHRYAQAVFYVHYINHVVRDGLASIEAGRPINLRELTEDICDATANCFSVLSGKRCRCTVWTVNPDEDLVFAFKHDRMTKRTRPELERPYPILENTDFKNLWYGGNGCARFFVARDVVELWKKNQYRSSGFDAFGEPRMVAGYGFSVVATWTLPFKSSLVVPIRYVPEECPWPAFDEERYSKMPVRPFVWGFLSIDSKSRRSFDLLHGPELAGAIADVLFILLQTSNRLGGADLPNVDPHGGKSDRLTQYAPHIPLRNGTKTNPSG
jgi:hypothetical protein